MVVQEEDWIKVAIDTLKLEGDSYTSDKAAEAYANITAKLCGLQAELAELRKDKARIDWLCEMDVEAAPIGDGFNVVLSYPCHDADLREAIDEAMKPAT